MRTAIGADRNAQSGYIAEDDQTKPEMLPQPITLRISSASSSKARSIAVMGTLKLLATPAVALRSTGVLCCDANYHCYGTWSRQPSTRMSGTLTFSVRRDHLDSHVQILTNDLFLPGPA